MLAVENLEVVYEDVILVLKGVSLQVPEGSIVALLGPNGAGKTTVIRAMTGLLDVHRGRISKGRVTLDAKDLGGLPAPKIVEAGIGQVMEGRRIFREFTVEENLKAGGHTASRADIAEGLERAYAMFPVLAERRKQTAGYLSGGEQQMLAISRALMTNPTLLILDEATEGLSPLLRQEIWKALDTLRAEGMSILVIDKNIGPLLRLCDWHTIVEKGHRVWEGDSSGLAADQALHRRYLGA